MLSGRKGLRAFKILNDVEYLKHVEHQNCGRHLNDVEHESV